MNVHAPRCDSCHFNQVVVLLFLRNVFSCWYPINTNTDVVAALYGKTVTYWESCTKRLTFQRNAHSQLQKEHLIAFVVFNVIPCTKNHFNDMFLRRKYDVVDNDDNNKYEPMHCIVQERIDSNEWVSKWERVNRDKMRNRDRRMEKEREREKGNLDDN